MTWRTLDRRNYYGRTLARPRISAVADVAGGMPLATINTHAMRACRGVLRTLLAYSGCSLTHIFFGDSMLSQRHPYEFTRDGIERFLEIEECEMNRAVFLLMPFNE
ncbi:hypothetical protein Y032_0005g2336 [Ancylostoma ceylanicum]|uniref:Uncharacterized protein n=1 Tax=Ancylostoma ceylanicum TaxID=53326 RepID=A0A016VQS5_9BILA|nr:hypothetical protein Y032_0005g2336 [Ancylostoma ceylanicum]